MTDLIDPPAPARCPLCGYPGAAAGSCASCAGEVLDEPGGAPVRPGRRPWPLEIAHGFSTFYRAAIHLLTRPEYFGRIGVPVGANVAASLLIAPLVYGIHGIMSRCAAWLPAWLDAVGAGFGSDATQGFVFTAVTTLLIAPPLLQTLTVPFLDPLADAVEKMLAGPGLRSVTASPWQGLTTNVRSSAQVLAMALIATVPCLVLSMWHLGLVVAVVIAALLNALLWFEIPFGRRGQDIDARIAIVRQNWGRALGFGLAFQLGMVIPFFNVLLLAPTAAVAVSMLYFHLEKTPALGLAPPQPPE